MKEPQNLNARGEINRLPCIFSAALTVRSAVCALAERQEQEGKDVLRCTQPRARAVCARLSGLLQEKAAFALARSTANAETNTLRLQCGGLEGLRQVLDPEAPAPDVQHLLGLAIERYAEIEKLPFQLVVRDIAHWRAVK